MTRTPVIRFLAACALGVAAACIGETKAPASSAAVPDGRDPHALVLALDSASASALEQRTGTWNSPDASSTWRAFIADGRVRRIDEQMAMTDSSQRRLVHYFTDGGLLAALEESRDQIVLNTDRPSTRSIIAMTLELIGDSATVARKVVDGTPKDVQKYEIDGARNHATALLLLAQTAAQTLKTP